MARKKAIKGWTPERRARHAATWARKHAEQAAAAEKPAPVLIPLDAIPQPAKRSLPVRTTTRDPRRAAAYSGVYVEYSLSAKAMKLVMDGAQFPFCIVP